MVTENTLEDMVADMDTPQDPETENTTQPELPADLKFLRLLITGLTGTMILGLVVLIAVIVIRFRDPAVDFPTSLTLPDGATATAYTQTKRWQAIVTEDDRILIYNRATGDLMQEITLEAGD